MKRGFEVSLKTVMFVTKQGHFQGTIADKLPSEYERLNILVSLFQCLCYSNKLLLGCYTNGPEY